MCNNLHIKWNRRICKWKLRCQVNVLLCYYNKNKFTIWLTWLTPLISIHYTYYIYLHSSDLQVKMIFLWQIRNLSYVHFCADYYLWWMSIISQWHTSYVYVWVWVGEMASWYGCLLEAALRYYPPINIRMLL